MQGCDKRISRFIQKHSILKHKGTYVKWSFPLLGLFSLIWFLIRVFPKPSRARYPCMRMTAPLASGFVIWVLGVGGSIMAFQKASLYIKKSLYIWVPICVSVFLVVAWVCFFNTDSLSVFTQLQSYKNTEVTADPVNNPIGEPKGCNPGRVVWIHDPNATNWNGPGSGERWWEPSYTDQTVTDSMMSRAICWLAGKSTETDAWETIFRYFNCEYNKGDIGYKPGERIAIKINLTTCNAQGVDPNTGEKISYIDKTGDTSPQMILALLRQLVNVVGVLQEDISVGDTVTTIPNQWYNYLTNEFPNVRYLDHYGMLPGRTRVKHSTMPFYWSIPEADGKLRDYLPVSFIEANYIINLAVLKGHMAGITVCAKNHYGSMIRDPIGKEWGVLKDYYNLHNSLPCPGLGQPGRGHYRALVDLMGHKDLGNKTLLYLIDALYGGYYWEGSPYKWKIIPFNGDWPSSLFVSQDGVAIDSVAYDFLVGEWPDVVSGGVWAPGSLEGGAQDYLHEAALANNAPSGTFYDPENDGKGMSSLGVHEHWNNAIDKQYSRNLGIGNGIELISSDPLKKEICIVLDLPKGWSMISLPVKPYNFKVSELFPEAVVIYGYEKLTGYFHIPRGENLEVGSGYWILLNQAKTFTITGEKIEKYNLSVNDGWYMIGGCTNPSQPSVDNGRIKIIYEYNQGVGYQRVLESETLKHGKGYWILLKYIIDQTCLTVQETIG